MRPLLSMCLFMFGLLASSVEHFAAINVGASITLEDLWISLTLFRKLTVGDVARGACIGVVAVPDVRGISKWCDLRTSVKARRWAWNSANCSTSAVAG